jgi:hypothetical protein
LQDAVELEAAVLRLLADAELRGRFGTTAQEFVLSQQGATERTLDALAEIMNVSAKTQIAA